MNMSAPFILPSCGALTLCIAVGAFAQTSVSWGRVLSPRSEAIALLQDSTSSTVLLDSALVSSVEDALRTIRTQIPDIAHLRVEAVLPSLAIYLDRDEGRLIRRRYAASQRPDTSGLYPVWTLRRTGHAGLDSLLRVYSAVRISFYDTSEREADFTLEVLFARALNMYGFQKQSTALGVRMVGGAQFTELTYTRGYLSMSDTLWMLRFVEGIGDCPAGCSGADHYLVTYDPRSHSALLVDKHRGRRPEHPSLPNNALLPTPHTLAVGCAVLRQRGVCGVRRSRTLGRLGGTHMAREQEKGGALNWSWRS